MRLYKLKNYYIKDKDISWKRSFKALGYQRIDSNLSFFPKPIVYRLIDIFSNIPIYKIGKIEYNDYEINNEFDLLLKLKNKNIFFDFKNDITTVKYNNCYLYRKNYYIRNISEVNEISPNILNWNKFNKSYSEKFIRGKRLKKNNVNKGLEVIKEIWPKLYKLNQQNYKYKNKDLIIKILIDLPKKFWLRLI